MSKKFDLEVLDLYNEYKFSIRTKEPKTSYKPSELFQLLDKLVIGQDKAKRALSIYITEHDLESKRLKKINSTEEYHNTKPTVILLVGSTGCGKTFITKTVSSILKKTYLCFDITRFSQVGYVGDNTGDIIKMFQEVTKGDQTLIDNSIIHLDEFDKLNNVEFDGDVSTTGVQRELLKILDNGVHTYKAKQHDETYQMDMSRVIFVLSGAFSSKTQRDLDSKDEAGIGLVKRSKSKAKPTKEFTHSKLIEAGFIPELVGRIDSIVHLESLTEKDLKSILINENGLLSKLEASNELREKKVTFTDKEINAIVKEAYEANLGARPLKSILNEKLLDKLWY